MNNRRQHHRRPLALVGAVTLLAAPVAVAQHGGPQSRTFDFEDLTIDANIAPDAGAPPPAGSAAPNGTAYSPDRIRTVVMQNVSQVWACAQAARQNGGHVLGRVAVHFVIGGDGRVSASSVVSTTIAAPAASTVPQCVANAARAWRFPAPGSQHTVEVNYPFSFNDSR